MNNSNYINQSSKDSLHGKTLPPKIGYDKSSPYFTLLPHDVINHILRQTTQLDKSTIHYPMRRHFKIRFQMQKAYNVK
jgi:hypothetical protein